MFIVMAGPAGCGKSYVAERLKSFGGKVVSRDKIRFALLDDNDDYFAKEEECERQFYDTISELLRDKNNIVVADATHINMLSRKKLFRRIGNLDGHTKIAFWVDGTEEGAKKLNSGRTGRALVPNHVIDRQFQMRQVPSLEEGFDDVIFVSPPDNLDQRHLCSISAPEARPDTEFWLADLLWP